jgi:hypothetical protein
MTGDARGRGGPGVGRDADRFTRGVPGLLRTEHRDALDGPPADSSRPQRSNPASVPPALDSARSTNHQIRVRSSGVRKAALNAGFFFPVIVSKSSSGREVLTRHIRSDSPRSEDRFCLTMHRASSQFESGCASPSQRWRAALAPLAPLAKQLSTNRKRDEEHRRQYSGHGFSD